MRNGRRCQMNLATLVGLGFLLGTGTATAVVPEHPPNVFKTEVEKRTVYVDVVVTQRDGTPVPDLSPDRFQLSSNGRPLAVEEFTVIGPNSNDSPDSPEARDGHTLILYVDDVNLPPGVRGTVLGRLAAGLERTWQPATRVMIVRRANGVRVEQPLTDDKVLALATLDRLRESGWVSPQSPGESRRLLVRAMADVVEQKNAAIFTVNSGPFTGTGPTDGSAIPGIGRSQQSPELQRIIGQALALVPQIQHYAESRQQVIREANNDLRTFLYSIAGIPGRKSLLLVSDGLSGAPASGFLDAYQKSFENIREIIARANLPRIAADHDSFPEFQDLARIASTHRIAIYTFDAGDSAERDTTTGGGTRGRLGRFDSTLGRTEDRVEREANRSLAEPSGGRALFGANAMDELLEAIVRDSTNRYVLGFEPPEGPDDGIHRIEVDLTGRTRGIDVHTVEALRERTLDERLITMTLSEFLQPGQSNSMQVGLEPQSPTPQPDGSWTVPVHVHVPLENLVLQPGTAVHQAEVALYVAVQDPEGRTSTLSKHHCPIQVPNEQLLVALGKEGRCGIQVQVAPGAHTISVTLRDELSAQESTASTGLEVGGGDSDGRSADAL